MRATEEIEYVSKETAVSNENFFSARSENERLEQICRVATEVKPLACKRNQILQQPLVQSTVLECSRILFSSTRNNAPKPFLFVHNSLNVYRKETFPAVKRFGIGNTIFFTGSFIFYNPTIQRSNAARKQTI